MRIGIDASPLVGDRGGESFLARSSRHMKWEKPRLQYWRVSQLRESLKEKGFMRDKRHSW
jgi:hypothetical protein